MFKGIKQLYAEIRDGVIKAERIRIGENWEQEVRDIFFQKEDYDVLEKTHSFKENKKDFVKSSLNPDYKFLCKYTKRPFYIECKSRDVTNFFKKNIPIQQEFEKHAADKKALRALEEKHKYSDIFEICSEEQFIRYKKINAETKVLFMILFYHEDPRIFPETVSLIPLDNMLVNRLYFDQFLEFQIPDYPVSSLNLWRHFVLFYGTKGHCVRCNSTTKYNNLNPFCYPCWEDWHKFKKFTYQEKYCHACGIEFETSSLKPLCATCFKKFPMNFPL